MTMRCDGIEDKMSAWCLIATLAIAFGLAGAAKAGLEQVAEVAAPLVATPIAPPNPVTGSDGKIHLALRVHAREHGAECGLARKDRDARRRKRGGDRNARRRRAREDGAAKWRAQGN